MATEEQILFSLPLSRMEPIFKNWVRDVISQTTLTQTKPINPADEEPINIQDVAKLTGKAVATIYSLHHHRKIPGYRKGQRLYFFRSQILEWIRTGKHSTIDEIKADALNSLAR
ncbi:MAG: helix-turn-helix domain-containing protein [Bacteroidales bacterium]|jgi:predicted DNA-binding transcriptional regulator AlpA|nr:helix-turn-helix domain-containing protein [Bacteroidales bacterium]